MGYVTPEQIAQAKEWDLLTYLQRYDPHQLVHVGGSTYCTREHDSLKISNGKWNWFSRKNRRENGPGLSHQGPGLSLYRGGGGPDGTEPSPRLRRLSQAEGAGTPEAGPPHASRCATHMVNYLHGRGIDYNVIDYCIQTGRLYESLPYHNAVFVGRDRQGHPRYAALRVS